MPYVSFVADILMIAASAGAAMYCLILSRRVSRLTSFDKGIGGAIAVLSAQVDDMKAALDTARSSTDGVSQQLADQLSQARAVSAELELMIAACHDFAEEAMIVQGAATAQTNARPSAPDASHVVKDPAPITFGSRRGRTEATARPAAAQV